jgi:hypothetical protein
MEIEFANNILNDLWDFHLVLIGISLSIFTLLYSFILSKRDDLKAISEQIKNDGKTPILAQREKFAVNYILRLKRINQNCICIFIVSTFLCCCSWITLRLINDFHTALKQWIIIIIGILTIILCLYVAVQFYKIYKQYNSETKI